MSEDKLISERQQTLLWNTHVSAEFNKLNFDLMLMPNNIQGLETYITINKKQIEGYEVKKQHLGDPTSKRYFVKSQDIKLLPAIIKGHNKVHDRQNVYYVVNSLQSFKITPEKMIGWREIIDYSGIPNHTNPTHFTLYKNKTLFGRTHPHVYCRIVTESAFGKDKYIEAYSHLINHSINISDPSTPKLFYAICHNRDVTINELPGDVNRVDFNKFCNMMMRIGDGTNSVANPSRATKGTSEVADTNLTSIRFLHNIPSYYHDKGLKAFEDIFPQNVINRYYYNLYEGYVQAEFPESFDPKMVAEMHQDYYKSWIKSVLWYEDNWSKLKNMYPEVNLSAYPFKKSDERFKDHFVKFAKCLSHYAESKEEYISLLTEEFKTHKKYEQLINEPDFKPGTLIQEERV